MSEHGIELVEFFNSAKQLSQLIQLRGARLGSFKHSDLYHQLFALGEELVQRRIQQSNRYWQTIHDAKESDEIGALHGQKFFQRRSTILFIVRQNHCAHVRKTVLGEEHVLGPAQSDALSA